MANGIAPDKLLAYRGIVFFTAAIAALALGAYASKNPNSPLELKAQDVLARVAPHAARPDIVIVAMDDNSVKKYGAVKSWPRSVLANGIRQVEKGSPKVVVLDLALDHRTKTGDEGLWRTMANNKNVVLGMSYVADRSALYTPDDIRSLVFLEKYAIADKLTLSPQTQSFEYDLFEPPVSDFTGSSRGVGVFLRESDSDGVMRNARLFYQSSVAYPKATSPIRGKFPVTQLSDGAPVALPNIALVTTLRVLDIDKQNVRVFSGNSVGISGNYTDRVYAPVDEQGKMRIKYAGGPGHFSTVSFLDLVNGKLPADTFKGKVVLFGSTAIGDEATDARLTPFPGQMPRVEITANTVSTLLDRSYVGQYAPRILGMMLILGLVTGGILMLTSGRSAAITGLLLMIAYFGLAYSLFAFSHTLLPLVPAICVILLTWVVAVGLSNGPFRPAPLIAPPMYIPPPPSAVH